MPDVDHIFKVSCDFVKRLKPKGTVHPKTKFNHYLFTMNICGASQRNSIAAIF